MARNDKRIDTYLAIDSERDFQDEKFAGKPDLSIEGSLVVLGKLHGDALLAWYAGDIADVLDHVRKIGGVATRCMEIHGAPLRKQA
jgi:hypothetical protein